MSSIMGSGFLNKIRKRDRIIIKSQPDVPPPNLFMGEPILPLSQICRKKARAKGSGKTFRKWLAKKFETRPSKKDELILHLRELLSASKVHCLVLDNRINQLQRTVTSRSRVLRETQRELSATKAEMRKCTAELAQVLVALTTEQSAHHDSMEMAEAEAARLQASSDLLRSEYLTTSADLKRTQVELTKTRQDAVDLQKEVNMGLVATEAERAKAEEARGEQEKTEKECAKLQDDLVVANANVHATLQELSLEKESKERLETSLGAAQEENDRLKEQLRQMSTALTKSHADAAQANAKLVEVNSQLISTQDELAVTMGELEDVEGKLAIAEVEVEARDAEILQWKAVYDEYNRRTADGFKEKDKTIVRLRKQLVRVVGKNERLQVELERSEYKLGESNKKLEYTITSLRNLTADASAKDTTIEEGQKQLVATQKELEETKKKLGHTISGIRNLNITLGDTKKRLHDTERGFHEHKVETSRAIASLHHDAEELKVQLHSTQNDLVASEDQVALLTSQLAQTRDNATSQSLEHETALVNARAHLTLAQNDLAVSKEKVDDLSLQLSDKVTALEVADAKLSDAITRADILEAQLDQVVQKNTLTVEGFSSKNKQLESIVNSLRSDLVSVSDNLESERSVRRTLEGKMTDMIEMMNSDMEQIDRGKRVIEEQLAAKMIHCKELEKENLSLKELSRANASTLSFSGSSSPTPLTPVTNMTPPARAAQQKARGSRWFSGGTFSPLGSSFKGSSSSPSEATDSQFHTK
ncbi:hypothetical protein NLI96_g8704 [Meripilus lineatus]|uniref:Uncharacterized protein n=1 Tax=Meripilus lineatus TaxID=2056292 RepID=A0AAD5UWY4_9APHY|nr:hypothetical protein NLI96_g8704 [Physisporinus lineatus]